MKVLTLIGFICWFILLRRWYKKTLNYTVDRDKELLESLKDNEKDNNTI